MFDIEGDKIKLSANAMAIPPFNDYYSQAKDKSLALKEIEYVVWLYKWNTPYKAYPPQERAGKVSKDVFKVDNFTPSIDLQHLIIRFNEFQYTPLIRLYSAAEDGLEYLISTLEQLKTSTLSSDELTLEEKLKVATQVSKLLKDVEPTSKSLDSAKKRAMAEQLETGRVKGGGQIGLYEMPRR